MRVLPVPMTLGPPVEHDLPALPHVPFVRIGKQTLRGVGADTILINLVEQTILETVQGEERAREVRVDDAEVVHEGDRGLEAGTRFADVCTNDGLVVLEVREWKAWDH